MRGYFLVADILGFSSIVKNLAGSALDQRMEDWTRLVEITARKFEIDRWQLISDTLFVGVDHSTEALRQLIGFSKALLEAGISLSIPIRGGITEGDYVWGRLTYGPAVIAAHELESVQEWVGVTASSQLTHSTELWGWDSLVCYPPPFKSGNVLYSPVVAWDVPAIRDLSSYLGKNGLAKDGQAMDWSIARTISNTIQFRIYLHKFKNSGRTPDKCYTGILPMDFLEKLLTNS